jgi:hypothetical protein
MLDELNIIFLDIDGVMNHANHFVRSSKHQLQEFCPRSERNLKRIIKEGDAKIVVSSSWRGYDTAEQIGQWLFSHYELDTYVIGVTPHLKNRERGYEIQRYIDFANHPITNFVILDDDRDMVHLLPHLVCTDYKWGLTVEKCEQAIKILKHSFNKLC